AHSQSDRFHRVPPLRNRLQRRYHRPSAHVNIDPEGAVFAIARRPPATPLARPVDLSDAWNASDARVADRFHPMYGPALARLPDGPVVFRGVRFELGRKAAGGRWILLDRELSIDLRGTGPASHV